MTPPGIIAERVSELSDKSDVELIAIKIENSHESGEPSVLTNWIAAAQILHDRQLAAEKFRHAELLAEIERPHWSVTPSFLVGVVAMIAACIAAFPVLFSQPQSPQSVVVVAPPVQTNQPASNIPSSSLQRLPISPTAQTGTAKR